MTDSQVRHIEAIRGHIRDADGKDHGYATACLASIEQECRALLDLCQRCGERPADGSRIMCSECWVATGEPV